MGPYVTFSTPLELVCVEDDEQIESKFNELFLSTGNKTRQQLFDLFSSRGFAEGNLSCGQSCLPALPCVRRFP